jgi:hypothetical protein
VHIALTGSERVLGDNFKIKGLIFVFSALVWVGSYLLDGHFLHFLQHTPGIDLVFIPSGVRLIVIMIGGIWAALGVCVGSLFLVGPEFQTAQQWVVLSVAVGSGLFPYAALRASLWATRVDEKLANLSAIKLPLISLGVAVGSSILHNFLFSALGLKPWQDLAENSLAMAAGDFIGILLAVAIVFVILRLIRRSGALSVH